MLVIFMFFSLTQALIFILDFIEGIQFTEHKYVYHLIVLPQTSPFLAIV